MKQFFKRIFGAPFTGRDLIYTTAAVLATLVAITTIFQEGKVEWYTILFIVLGAPRVVFSAIQIIYLIVLSKRTQRAAQLAAIEPPPIESAPTQEESPEEQYTDCISKQ